MTDLTDVDCSGNYAVLFADIFLIKPGHLYFKALSSESHGKNICPQTILSLSLNHGLRQYMENERKPWNTEGRDLDE